MKKKKLIIFLGFIFIVIIYITNRIGKEDASIKNLSKNEPLYSSNIIENVNYTTKDRSGNEYKINAEQGEIEYNKENIIFLTNVKAIITLEDNEKIYVKSDYGKYDTISFDTIFSKNVKIDYLENTITGDYLDFSITRNSMIISKNVVSRNLENMMIADVIEMNIETKDTKIFMYDKKKQVKIKSIK